jgi:hypothetical protein
MLPLRVADVGFGCRGKVHKNNAAGRQPALVSISSIAGQSALMRVDYQIPANGSPATLSARVEEAPAVAAGVPPTGVSGLHPDRRPDQTAPVRLGR